MIPKIIHYCWFGGGIPPAIVQKCIKSWYKFCPNYQIQLWNETNYNISQNTYIEEAYKLKKWAFVSDFARLDIIYRHGGIYLDTDVEILQSLDPLLSLDCFVAADGTGIATGLGFGAYQKHPIIKRMRDLYKNKKFLTLSGPDLTPCTKLNTKIFSDLGYSPNTKHVIKMLGVTILPPEYFSPINGATADLTITKNTYGIHWNSRLWETGFTRLKSRIRLKVGLTAIKRIKKFLRYRN